MMTFVHYVGNLYYNSMLLLSLLLYRLPTLLSTALRILVVFLRVITATLRLIYRTYVRYNKSRKSWLTHIHDGGTVGAYLLKETLLPNMKTCIEQLCMEAYDFFTWLGDELNKDDRSNSPSHIISSMRERGKLVRYLGAGSAYEVHEMRSFFLDHFARKALLEDYALDEPDKRAEAEENLRGEAVVWRHLQTVPHPHIARLRNDHTAGPSPSIDYYPVGEMDLQTFMELEWHHGSRSLELKKQLMGHFGCLRDMIHHLHNTAYVLHNDIKASNIILRQGHLYLIDFGTSRILTRESGFTCSEQTNHSNLFRAPEWLDQETQSFPADIFPLGLLYLYMLTVLCGGSLERLSARKQLPEKVGQKHREINGDQDFSNPLNLTWVIQEHLPNLNYEKLGKLCSLDDFKSVKALITRMIDTNPARRPPASQIKLPSSFEASCCSRLLATQPRQSLRLKIDADDVHTQIGPQNPVVATPEVEVVNVRKEEIKHIENHHNGAYLRPPAPNLVFADSQTTTEVCSVSSTLSPKKMVDIRSTLHKEELASPRELLVGLAGDKGCVPSTAHTASIDEWSAKRSDKLDWHERLHYFEKLPQQIVKDRTECDESPSWPLGLSHKRRVSTISRRSSTPTQSLIVDLQDSEFFSRPDRQLTWPWSGYLCDD